jgi:hypothetical protein
MSLTSDGVAGGSACQRLVIVALALALVFVLSTGYGVADNNGMPPGVTRRLQGGRFGTPKIAASFLSPVDNSGGGTKHLGPETSSTSRAGPSGVSQPARVAVLPSSKPASSPMAIVQVDGYSCDDRRCVASSYATHTLVRKWSFLGLAAASFGCVARSWPAAQALTACRNFLACKLVHCGYFAVPLPTHWRAGVRVPMGAHGC